MAGPLYYPPADRTIQWINDTGTFQSGVEKVVLHCTEGTGWPGYNGGASAPHFTVMGDFDQKRLVWRQHFRMDRYSRSLRNPAGGVQTNIDGAITVEIIGTCNRKTSWKEPHLHMWDLPEWALRGLADWVRWCHVEHGIPLVAPGLWPAYPSSPTLDARARMSGAEWNAFRGVCGHLHVPENTHLDPGDFPIGDLLTLAGDTVALTAGQTVDAVETALRRNIARNENGPTPTVETISVADGLRMTDTKLDSLRESVIRIELALQALTDRVAQLDSAAIEAAMSEGVESLRLALLALRFRVE
jgi:hypothetical protein